MGNDMLVSVGSKSSATLGKKLMVRFCLHRPFSDDHPRHGNTRSSPADAQATHFSCTKRHMSTRMAISKRLRDVRLKSLRVEVVNEWRGGEAFRFGGRLVK